MDLESIALEYKMLHKSKPSIEELKNLSELVSQRLWDINQNNPKRPHLIFPEYRDNKIRVSEQESKVIFTNVLEETRWFYSVETPTVETYIQSGSTPLSARTDISLYASHSTSSKVLNIELKAHNPSKESFRKDLEKIVREGLDGLWFHTLDNSNRGTLPSIYQKIHDAFHDLLPYLVGKERNILFAFCTLQKRELIQKVVCINGSNEEIMSNIKKTFKE
jgi:hypothetical protein